MAAGAVYTTPRACERCNAGLPSGSSVNRRFCDRCRDVRRAITFLNQAALAIGVHAVEGTGIAAAHRYTHLALEELGG